MVIILSQNMNCGSCGSELQPEIDEESGLPIVKCTKKEECPEHNIAYYLHGAGKEQLITLEQKLNEDPDG